MRKLIPVLTAVLICSCSEMSGINRVKEPKISPEPSYSFGKVSIPEDPLEDLKSVNVTADFSGVPLNVALKAICKAKKLACNLTGFKSSFPITISHYKGSLYNLLKEIEKTTRYRFSYENKILTVINSEDNTYAREVERKIEQQRLKVSGPKISLNLQGVPLFMVFNEINAKTNYTIVPDRDVDLSQNVFVAVKDMSLDKALKVILTPLGYSFEIEPATKEVHVSSLVTKVFKIPYIPKEIEFTYSAGETQSGGTATSSTDSSSSFSENKKTTTIKTNFWDELERTISNIVTKRGTYLINRTARIVTVTDTPENIGKVERVINSLIKAVSQQCQFRVAVYEVTYSDEFQSGVDWSAVFGSQNIQITNAPTTGYVFDLSGYFKAGRNNPFSYVVRLLSRYGKVKTIYDNYIRTLSGETVAVVPGETYRFLESVQVNSQQDTGLVTQTPIFKELSLGIQLYITPVKKNEKETEYDVAITNRFIKSLRSYTIGSDSYIEPERVGRTELSMTTIIPQGRFEVITGIKQYRIENAQSGVPGVMDIPVAGELFKNRNRTARLSEYVIAIYSY